MTRDLLSLSNGPLELELIPSVGGAISALRYVAGDRRLPVLREGNSASKNVLDAASFPLVPFVNRVRGGRFRFRGREVRLAPNMAGDPSPLHGQGWLAPWNIERSGPAEAELRFDHDPGEWPWAYEARQHFQLDPEGLTLTLTCRNRSDDPMPCGLGQHPYFNCGPRTRLDTEVTEVWTIDADVLPVDRIAATGPFDLRDRPICSQDLDHGFGGWSGRARISDPDWPFDIEMSSPTARFFQVYSPPGGRFFDAEPVTHANAALNEPEESWAELGLRVLQPGEELSLEMRIAVREK